MPDKSNFVWFVFFQFVGYVCKFRLHPLANFHNTFVCKLCLPLHPLKGDFQEGISLLNGTLFRSFSVADDRKRTGDIRCKQLKLNVLGQSPFESFGRVQTSRQTQIYKLFSLPHLYSAYDIINAVTEEILTDFKRCIYCIGVLQSLHDFALMIQYHLLKIF